MTGLEILALASLLSLDMGRWFTMAAPPPELINNLEFFKQADMLEHLDLLERAPVDPAPQAPGASR